VIIGGRSGAGRRTSSAGSDCSDLTALTAAPWTAVPAAAGPAVHGPPHHAPVAYVTARPAVHDPSGTHRPARTREYGECRRREDAAHPARLRPHGPSLDKALRAIRDRPRLLAIENVAFLTFAGLCLENDPFSENRGAAWTEALTSPDPGRRGRHPERTAGTPLSAGDRGSPAGRHAA